MLCCGETILSPEAMEKLGFNSLSENRLAQLQLKVRQGFSDTMGTIEEKIPVRLEKINANIYECTMSQMNYAESKNQKYKTLQEKPSCHLDALGSNECARPSLEHNLKDMLLRYIELDSYIL